MLGLTALEAGERVCVQSAYILVLPHNTQLLVAEIVELICVHYQESYMSMRIQTHIKSSTIKSSDTIVTTHASIHSVKMKM